MPQQRTATFEGKTYTVPADASDDEVLAFVQSQLKPKTDPRLGKPHADIATLGAMMPMTPPSAVLESTKEHLPMLGAMAAGYATGGAGPILGMLAEGAGAMAGSATADKLSGRDVNIPGALGEGAMFAAGSGVIRGLRAAKDAGRALWTRVSGEARPTVREAIMSRGGSGVTPADIERVHQEARATDFTPGTPAREPSQILDATGKPAIQGAAEQPAQYGPLWDAYHSMKNIRSNIPSLSGRTATGATVGGGLGYMGGGEGASRVGAKLGALTGLLTHPSIGLNAGKALYGTPNIITQGAQAVNPAVATETMRQLVALMLSGKQ